MYLFPLDTPYLSDQIRLGIGARGSTFVFERIPEEDSASSEYEIALDSKPLTQKQVSGGENVQLLSI